jgi:hypothetical protein
MAQEEYEQVKCERCDCLKQGKRVVWLHAPMYKICLDLQNEINLRQNKKQFYEKLYIGVTMVFQFMFAFFVSVFLFIRYFNDEPSLLSVFLVPCLILVGLQLLFYRLYPYWQKWIAQRYSIERLVSDCHHYLKLDGCVGIDVSKEEILIKERKDD